MTPRGPRPGGRVAGKWVRMAPGRVAMVGFEWEGGRRAPTRLGLSWRRDVGGVVGFVWEFRGDPGSPGDWVWLPGGSMGSTWICISWFYRHGFMQHQGIMALAAPEGRPSVARGETPGGWPRSGVLSPGRAIVPPRPGETATLPGLDGPSTPSGLNWWVRVPRGSVLGTRARDAACGTG